MVFLSSQDYFTIFVYHKRISLKFYFQHMELDHDSAIIFPHVQIKWKCSRWDFQKHGYKLNLEHSNKKTSARIVYVP